MDGGGGGFSDSGVEVDGKLSFRKCTNPINHVPFIVRLWVEEQKRIIN